MINSYLNRRFLSCINPDRVKIIIECGSRDGLDALELYKYYNPERMYTFECNPEAIALCKQNIQHNSSITLVEKAVYNKDGMIDFFPANIEISKDKNIGASSLLWHRDNKEEFFQKKIQVEATRLDTFMKQEKLDRINLLCMDVQGVEMEVFEGLGDYLSMVQYLITEVVFEHYYIGDHLFSEVRRYLDQHGFNLLIGSGALGDRKEGLTNCLFKNRKRVT
jgi:FkbM family methyltransferase